MSTGDQSALNPEAGHFTTTHWSVVLAAGHQVEKCAQEALAKLYHTYKPPLYSFLRRTGYSPQDAEDLIQDFFVHLLKKEALGRADPAKGRFRSFLLSSLKHFLVNWHEYNQAQKRGGGRPLVRLDADSAETWHKLEPADNNLTPDKAYERRWALTLLSQVLARLRDEHVKAGKLNLFEEIKGYLSGDNDLALYAEVARKNGTTENAIKMMVSRLRQRYRELIREEIAQTVASPEEIDDELRYLLAALG